MVNGPRQCGKTTLNAKAICWAIRGQPQTAQPLELPLRHGSMHAQDHWLGAHAGTVDGVAILHFNVTRNPHALWVGQQLREVWGYKEPHRFLLFDRDAKFGADVVSAVRDMGSQPTRTAFRSPWQISIPFRDSAACTIVMRRQRRLKSYSSEDQTLFLVTAARLTSSASIFRRSTNQPATPHRRAYANQEEIRVM
jgi:hypothetical protein